MTTPELPETGNDGRARARALARLSLEDVTPTSTVQFVSRGRCLVIGAEPDAQEFAKALDGQLDCVVLVPGAAPASRAGRSGPTTVNGGEPRIRGALGDFEVLLAGDGEPRPLGLLLSPPVSRFDLVVDLGSPPLLRQAMTPLGYFAPGPDESARAELLETLPEMRGEFEKPKYFNYNPEICAHGRNGKRACTRCIDACPAEAIISTGETVEVNPYLCQGGGACAMVCPGGAMTYAYPVAADMLRAVRGALEEYRRGGGTAPCVMYHDEAAADRIRQDLAAQMPERVLPVAIEEIGSVGMETWFATLAYGAEAVVLLTTDRTPPQVVEALQEQVGIARALLAGLGHDERCLGIVNADQSITALETLAALPGSTTRRPATFAAPPADKRGTLRLALLHLQPDHGTAKRSVALPQGAPFGEVRVDGDACTLCMSCVSACPTHALQDGHGLPQLNFREWNCIQCGLCERTCPEDAISLAPRLLLDVEARERPRTLHEEQPVCCVSCGKPFATRSVLDKLSRKLEGHWMFQTDEARRRLQMCEDCRVRDLYTTEARRPR